MHNNHEHNVFSKIYKTLVSMEMEDFSIQTTEGNPDFDTMGDILLYFKSTLIGIIEVKNSKSIENALHTQIIKWSKSKYKFQFYILINHLDCYVFNEVLYSSRDTFYTLEEALLYISKNMRNQSETINESNASIKNQILQLFYETFSDLVDKSVLREIVQGLELDYSKKTITVSEALEMNLIDCLLKSPEIGTKIYKYTSLDSAFLTINHKQFLMSGIVGMNDTTEVDYVESYLFKISIEDHKKHWKNIENLNNKFIMSCTALKDDLTMWRLYGDDFQGALLELEVLKPRSGYIVKHVHYAKKNGEDTILEGLKRIYNEIFNRWGLKLVFKRIEIWKHFFKPYEYAIEKEIRILYTGSEADEKLWNLTYTHKILNPFIFVKMDEAFPFKIKKIYLGRKSASFMTNEYQFQQLLRERGLNKEINVFVSSIVNYR